jgi:hypothetical protein
VNSRERTAIETLTVDGMVDRLELAKDVTIKRQHLIGQTGREGRRDGGTEGRRECNWMCGSSAAARAARAAGSPDRCNLAL